MTLSRSKRAAKNSRASVRKTEEQRLQEKFRGRKGPGGGDLDWTEAVSWFPELDVHDKATAPIQNGCECLLSLKGMKFWVRDVELSVQAPYCFGDIYDSLPDNAALLMEGNNIGFEPRHVIVTRPAAITDRVKASRDPGSLPSIQSGVAARARRAHP